MAGGSLELESLRSPGRGTWAFVLEEVGEGTTRLILRERSGHKPHVRDVVFHYLFMERQHFIMERRMLKGIKERRRGHAKHVVQPSRG